MIHILMLLSSPRGKDSVSTKVARALADRLTSAPGATLKIRDLSAEALPHIDSAYTAGRFLPPEQRTPAQAEAATRAETLIEELMAADVLVIAAAMNNFAPTSTLKAWLDHIVWPGRTMIPTHDGPQGMVTGKKAYLVAASGGTYSSGPMAPLDFLIPYLKATLGFIGITDIETIRAEGQTAGPEEAEKGVATAMAQVALVAQPVREGAAVQAIRRHHDPRRAEYHAEELSS